jgi:hypothetical protein
LPVIARFYGIVIKMYFNDHLPPHFHAVYGEYNGLFDLNSLAMLEGDLPSRARSLILEWARKNHEALLHMWHTQEFQKLEGLE